MRLTARYKTFKKLYFDDGFVIFSWFLALFTAIIWQIVARFMYQFMAITSGQLWPPPTNFVNDTERYYKGSVVVLIFFYTSLWAVKISFLFFFKRLGQNVRWQKILWWCVLAFTVATYFVCIGDIQYSCLAAPLGEIISHCSSDRDVNFQLVTLKFNAAIDVLTDVMSNACLSAPEHRSAAYYNSFVNPDQSAMESQNLTAPQACPDGHLLSCHHHHGLRHCPCCRYQLRVTSTGHVLVLYVELH